MAIILFLILVVGLAGYVRFVPAKQADWHELPTVWTVGDHALVPGFVAVRDVTAPSEVVLAGLRDIALSTDRTVLFAGSVDTGLMTFQTRSKVAGFPDYTTVQVKDGVLTVYGRLRFGRSDLGVNKARIITWLGLLGPLTEPL